MPDLERKYPDFVGKIRHARQLGIFDNQIEQLLIKKYKATPTDRPEEDLNASSVLRSLSEGVFEQDPTIISNISLVGKPLEVLLNILELPQTIATAAIGDYTDTGRDPSEGFLSRLARSQDPSELLGLEGIPALAADILLDPLNITTGKGLVTAIKAVGKERKLAQMAGVVKETGKKKAAKGVAGKKRMDDFSAAADDVENLFPNRQQRIKQAEEIALNQDDYTKLLPTSKELDKIAGEQFKALVEKKQIEFFDPKATKIPLNVQIINQINLGNISFDEAAKALMKKGVSKKDAVAYLAGKTVESQKEATLSAQKLAFNRHFLPKVEKAIQSAKDPEYQKLFDEIVKKSDKVDGDGIFKRFYKSTTNIWRASLVSQLGTGIRNAITASGRMGLDVAQKALDAGIQKIPGIETKTNMFDAVEPVLKLFGKNKEVTEKILASFPRQKDRLLNIVASDITTGKGKKFVDRYTRFINAFNLFQERIFRRAVFQAEIQRIARKQGLKLDDLIRPENFNKLDERDIKKAVEKALDMTFAGAPRSKLGKSFVTLISEAPGALLLLPFPRFLVNSMRFFYEFSPTGMMKLVNPTGKEFKRMHPVNPIFPFLI